MSEPMQAVSEAPKQREITKKEVALAVGGAMGVIFVGYMGFSFLSGLAKKYSPTPPSPVAIPLSDARLQIIDSGLAGSRLELQKHITQSVNEYFKGKGLNCDPYFATPTPEETLRQAQVCPPMVPRSQ